MKNMDWVFTFDGMGWAEGIRHAFWLFGLACTLLSIGILLAFIVHM